MQICPHGDDVHSLTSDGANTKQLKMMQNACMLTSTNKTIQYVSIVTAALVTAWSIAAYLMTRYIITFIDIWSGNY